MLVLAPLREELVFRAVIFCVFYLRSEHSRVDVFTAP
jgi:membrane protease YdiL (CAAX protease family)